MNKKPSVRNVGAVCVGTVLLGLGCTEREEQPAQSKDQLFDEPPAPKGKIRSQDEELPQPSFGPMEREVVEQRRAEIEFEPPVRLSDPIVSPPALSQRETLLTTTSDTAIAVLEESTIPAQPSGLTQPNVVNDHVPPLELPTDPEADMPAVDEAQEGVPDEAAQPPEAATVAASDSERMVSPDDKVDDETPSPMQTQEAETKPETLALRHVEDKPRHAAPLTIATGETAKVREETPELPPSESSMALAASPTTTAIEESPPTASLAEQSGYTPARRSIPSRQESTAPDKPEKEAALLLTQSASQPTSVSLVPPARAQTTLGLGETAKVNAAEEARLTDNNQSIFTASTEPPVLSYQDELILEVKVKGVPATDTILAYGTRAGIYLPIGTLARILDVAITVSDDGNYANGWVLDEHRTVTINLREGTLETAGEVIELAADTAVAFDGELYYRADRLGQIMPLTAETSLRTQSVTLETLEPFPFEERMRREAERRKLAARGIRTQETKFPREETPYLAASLPLVDLELRALSDSGAGTRLEADMLLASDLGFLTAEAFLGADSSNGLVTSLVEFGRMDPDAELLGPLQATEFSAGDVSTVSMPIGLRSVTGRGFMATNVPVETVSVFERIDLRGILPDGYEVELYRNDILVGSTRESTNGQYEFLQVPVDFGLNIFRLVFFGPQGQRSEQVRRVSVGDGRLAPGKLVYRIGVVQKDENVFGVRSPRFVPAPDFGAWRASGELAYGLSSDITTVLSGAWFETANDDRWIASAGVRTGIGRFAVKADLAAASGNSYAMNVGIGGRFGGSAVTLSHTEYSGEFIDETRSIAGEFLRRSTELDLNTTLNLGNPATGLIIPITARARHVESANGRKQTNVAVRGSARFSSLLASNTLEYTRTSLPQAATFSRLFGNFDLATVGRNRTRGRLSLGYQVLPDPMIQTAGLELDHAFDENTAIRGSISYAFQSKSTQVGLSAVRDFERFTLALDGSYGFREKSYSVGLRLGVSFGRDPLRGNFFFARPGLASSGGASIRAFRDMDGDGVFGPADSILPEVDVVAFNQTVPTGEDGIARLSGLGRGRGVSIQVDPTTLPDIDLAPAKDGIEIVPRPGRIHATEFPVIALSEVEGNVSFVQNGSAKGVSGVRLELRDANGKALSFTKTEIDGYFFFERVKPGTYEIVLESEQSQRLNLCMSNDKHVRVGFEPDLIKRDIEISLCGASTEVRP